MRESAQELITPVVVHNGLGDQGSEPRHAGMQPRRNVSRMQWKVGAAAAFRHMSTEFRVKLQFNPK